MVFPNPKSRHPETEQTTVMTTVLVTDDTDWFVSVTPSPQGEPRMLLQDHDINIGIMGTHEQLSRMVDRMLIALQNPITPERLVEILHG